MDDIRTLAVAHQHPGAKCVCAYVADIVTELDAPDRGQIVAAQYAHRAVTGIRHKYAIRKRDIRNALRLAQPGDLSQYLARCQINHAEVVVDEFGTKQPLSLQIDAEVIDAAAHLPERYLCLEYERWARRLSTGSRRARRGSPPEGSPTPARSALRDIDLRKRRLQPLGKLLRVIIGPEVHEVEVRLIVEHVVVDRRNLDPVLTQRPQDRVYFLAIRTKSPVIAALPPPVA